MAPISFKLRLNAGHARLVFAHGGVADVSGEELDRLLESAGPLLTRIRGESGGSLRAVSVRSDQRVLRATFDDDGGITTIRIDGAQFDEEITPLVNQIDWD
jgi:hypothetical protein